MYTQILALEFFTWILWNTFYPIKSFLFLFLFYIHSQLNITVVYVYLLMHTGPNESAQPQNAPCSIPIVFVNLNEYFTIQHLRYYLQILEGRKKVVNLLKLI